MDGVVCLPSPAGILVPTAAPRATRLPSALVLLTVSGLLFFLQLQVPLLEPQEPRYAEISCEMLTGNSWVVPVLHGQPYLDKPPFFYWLIMLSYQVFGVHDWTARLVPGLAGVLTVLVTWRWGCTMVGERAGFWSALILCLSARFVYLQRLLTFDSVLCLTVTGGLAAAHLAVREARLGWRWWLASAVACGLGVLTKGPVAVVLVLPPVLVYQYLDSRCPRLRLTAVAAYLGVVALVAGPWFAAVMIMQPGFAGYFFWTHNVVRFVAPFDHEEPFWFHVPGLLLGLLPWSLLLPGMLGFVVHGRQWSGARRPAPLVFFLLASSWSILFFSVAGCKRAVYILPAIPPLALALGSYLSLYKRTGDASRPSDAGREAALRSRRSSDWLAGLGSALLLVAGMVAVLIAARNRLATPAAALGAGVLLTALVPLLCFSRFRNWPCCAGLSLVLLVGALHGILPGYGRQFALRDPLLAHGRQGSDDLLVLCYPQCWESVSFYLPGARVKVFAAGERGLLLQELQVHQDALLVLRSGRWQRDVVEHLPPGVEFVVEYGQGGVVLGRVRSR